MVLIIIDNPFTMVSLLSLSFYSRTHKRTNTHTHTHALINIQPRSDHQFDADNLSSCLKVQPLSCNAAGGTVSGAGSHGASSSSSNKSHKSNKSTKLKPLKTEKSPKIPSIAVHHHPGYSTDLCAPPQLMPSSLSEAPPPSDYYHGYTSHVSHLGPVSPGGGMLHGSMISPPSHHSGSAAAAAVQGYQLQSPKMAQLSPGSAAFPSNQASPHPAPPPIYTSDPASPMQVTYSPNSAHGQPLMPQMTSSGAGDNMALYHDSLMNTNNGHNVVSVAFTAAGQAASIGLHHPPHILPTQFLPPPNYSEAVALNGAGAGLPGVHTTQAFDHLHSTAAGYNPADSTACTVGGEYHQGSALPPAGMLGLTSNHF